MKRIISFIFILCVISGCVSQRPVPVSENTEEIMAGSVIKVNVSPHAPILTLKRIGVLPFAGKNQNLCIYLARSVADNLVVSGLQVIEYDHLMSELTNLEGDKTEIEEEVSIENMTNEWEEFKRLFKDKDKNIAQNLIALKKHKLVDYILTGRVGSKDWLIYKSNTVTEANLDIVDIKDGKIIYSISYILGNGEPLTSKELSERLANALIEAMQPEESEEEMQPEKLEKLQEKIQPEEPTEEMQPEKLQEK